MVVVVVVDDVVSIAASSNTSAEDKYNANKSALVKNVTFFLELLLPTCPCSVVVVVVVVVVPMRRPYPAKDRAYSRSKRRCGEREKERTYGMKGEKMRRREDELFARQDKI